MTRTNRLSCRSSTVAALAGLAVALLSTLVSGCGKSAGELFGKEPSSDDSTSSQALAPSVDRAMPSAPSADRCASALALPVVAQKVPGCVPVSAQRFLNVSAMTVAHVDGKPVLYFMAGKTDLIELAPGAPGAAAQVTTIAHDPTWGIDTTKPDGDPGRYHPYATGGPLLARGGHIYFTLSFEPKETIDQFGQASPLGPNTPGSVWDYDLAAKKVTPIATEVEPYVGGLTVDASGVLYWTRSYPLRNETPASTICDVRRAIPLGNGRWSVDTFATGYDGACPEAGPMAVTGDGRVYWATGGNRIWTGPASLGSTDGKSGDVFWHESYSNETPLPPVKDLHFKLETPRFMVATGNTIILESGANSLWRYDATSGLTPIALAQAAGDSEAAIEGLAVSGSRVYLTMNDKLIRQPLDGGCPQLLWSGSGTLGAVAVDESSVYVATNASDGQLILRCSL